MFLRNFYFEKNILRDLKVESPAFLNYSETLKLDMTNLLISALQKQCYLLFLHKLFTFLQCVQQIEVS